MIRLLVSVGAALVLIILMTANGPVSGSAVTIVNNGYRGFVVAIHENVTEDIRIIENIKAMITRASKHLHHVTRKRAFLEEVTIVVPSSWSSKPEYQTILGGSGDLFRKAEVRVDAPNPSYGNEPYTLQPGECGERGQYVHLTPEFLVGDDTMLPQGSSATSNGSGANTNLNERSPAMFSPYGELAPVFVHEFAHLRYGVFDEHGVQGDPTAPMFFKDGQGKIRPTGCPSGLRGMLGDSQGRPCRRGRNGLPDDQCTFYPNLNPNSSTRLSIMYMPGVDLADGFCDEESPNRRHNPIAPNKHNLMCQGRSTWDVVSSNADFARNKNPPREIPDTTPKFRLIRPMDYRHQTVILVLDLSGSMAGHRMQLLHSAVTRFIKYELPSNMSTLGIVGFDEKAKVISELTEVTDAIRDSLIARVPAKEMGGYTSIGIGIREAVNMLKRGKWGVTEGARILLVSDGEENRPPNVEDTMAEVISAGVVVTTIALGKQASSKLEDLVRATAGNGYFYDDKASTSLTGMDASFAAAVTVNAPVELQPVEIGNRNATLGAKESLESYFHVDKEVGKETAFRVTYDTAGTNVLNIVIISPSGQKFDSKSPEFREDAGTKTVGFVIPLAESGKWTYTIENTGTVATRVTLVISSEAKDQSDQPIRIRSWISDIEFTHPARVKVYAEVKKGYAAVFHASVTANVYRPDGTAHPTPLFDNGVGADTTANDGIYSAYFAKFQGSGRYSVEANVLNDGKAKLILGQQGKSSTAPIVPRLPEGTKMDDDDVKDMFLTEELLVEKRVNDNGEDTRKSLVLRALDNFERFAVAGSFRLNAWQDNVDAIPPSRVNDLRSVETDLTNRTVHLVWTAVGDDLYDGIAHQTEVRFDQDPSFLWQSFNSTRLVEENMLQNGSSLQPQEPSTLHHVVISLPSEEDGLVLNETNYRVFFALRTRDEAGNVAAVSNLAVAEFNFPTKPLTDSQTGDESALKRWPLIVLVAVAGCLVLVAVAATALLIWRRRTGSQSYRRSESNEQL